MKRFLIILIVLILPLISQGGLIDEINQQIKEQEDKRAELERQAQEYQEIINQKQGEIKSLKNQIAIFNARINKLQIEINITEDDIVQTKLEILQLEYGIDQTGEDITEQKSHLAKIIQTIAEYDQTSQLEIILASEDFSDFFNQIAYLDNLQNGVKEKVDQLKLLKEKLGQDKESKEAKKERLETLKNQLNQQKWSLASQRKSKETLLNYTRGEEDKYQQMLAHIESQKKSLLGDLNRLRQLKAAELARLKELQEKPPTQYWASTNWYYQQDDSRWAKTTIGISDSRLEDYGCAITSVAMILKYHGTSITPGQLAKESIYAGDLIYWPRKWGSIYCMNCPPPHVSSFNWFRLDRELGAGYPVIVFVKANGRGAGHYVVVHHKTEDGRYVVHDPLFGANIYLDSTRVYISNLYETTTSLDQMVIYH
ncbi:MAG: C39 family peptidase [Candidatus Portnoybacteria bacterium]|nr:C39 family peptidase [Candidatus Portnoybacteria bacterium]